MADRCWAFFRVRNVDADKAVEIIGDFDDRQECGKVTEFTVNEMTGGGYDAAHALRASGIPHKWVCETYPGGWDSTLSAFDGEVEVTFTVSESGSPILEADGFSLTDASVKNFRRNLKVLERIEKFLRA